MDIFFPSSQTSEGDESGFTENPNYEPVSGILLTGSDNLINQLSFTRNKIKPAIKLYL